MRAFLQQHSFLIGAALALAGLGFFLLGAGLRPWRIAVVVAAAAAFAGSFCALRTGPAAARAGAVAQAVHAGGPVLVEVYSDF